MPENQIYLPEGLRPPAMLSAAAARAAMESGTILESMVLRCDAEHALHVRIGALPGVIPREEAVSPWVNGADRDIALLSRVGKPVCFRITALRSDGKGSCEALLSRKAVQEEALDFLLQALRPGRILTAKVTHLEPFGAFLDIGCGLIAMLPCESISVARIAHPADRFQVGQKVLVAVASINEKGKRFTMTHKELLGTWMENASWFQAGETVAGIVRSVKSYGAFVELTPNLSGLADSRDGVREGDRVSVYIKSIRPERMKIKLQIIDRLPPEPAPPLRYQITDGQLTRWIYSPPNYEREPVETCFCADPKEPLSLPSP